MVIRDLDPESRRFFWCKNLAMSKKAYYFSHDRNYRNSNKIIDLRMNHGWEGYGIYLVLLEMCCNNNQSIDLNPPDIAREIKCNVDMLTDIIYNKKLFDISDNLIKPKGIEFKWGTTGINHIIDDRVRMYEYDIKGWCKIREEIFERDNYTCNYCGQIGGKLEADHVIAFSKGGTDDLENLVTSCRRCNRQKKDKSVEEFLKWKNNGKTT